MNEKGRFCVGELETFLELLALPHLPGNHRRTCFSGSAC